MTADEIGARIYLSLNKLTCPNNYHGYIYLKDSVAKVLKDNIVTGFTKFIYSPIGDKYNTDAANVDRCIRTLVGCWWESNKCGGIFEKKPKNRQVISTLSERIRMEAVCERFMETKRRERKEIQLTH